MMFDADERMTITTATVDDHLRNAIRDTDDKSA